MMQPTSSKAPTHDAVYTDKDMVESEVHRWLHFEAYQESEILRPNESDHPSASFDPIFPRRSPLPDTHDYDPTKYPNIVNDLGALQFLGFHRSCLSSRPT
jgi:hypothetical protein